MGETGDAGAGRGGRSLRGLRIAFTGRLASTSRAGAAELVARWGGTFAASVSRSTDLLVVGGDGWPVRRDGRPTRKLRRAETLARRGGNVEVLAERDFLARLGLGGGDAALGPYPLAALVDLLGVTRRQVESWVRSGLVGPAETRDGVDLFDYRRVAAMKSLAELLAAGVPVRSLGRSLRRLRAWLPEAADPLAALSRLALVDGRLVFRTSDGRAVEPTGQLLFEFPAAEAAAAVPITEALTEDGLFELAVAREQAGELVAAADLYRRVLLEVGPDPEVAFNLGNVLYALRDADAAAERFRQAAELDPGFAEAWNNLGYVLSEGRDAAAAAEAFRRALAADPDYADARFGLADALEAAGSGEEARLHWKAYLAAEPDGPWSDYARSRLADPTGRTA